MGLWQKQLGMRHSSLRWLRYPDGFVTVIKHPAFVRWSSRRFIVIVEFTVQNTSVIKNPSQTNTLHVFGDHRLPNSPPDWFAIQMIAAIKRPAATIATEWVCKATPWIGLRDSSVEWVLFICELPFCYVVWWLAIYQKHFCTTRITLHCALGIVPPPHLGWYAAFIQD